MPRPNLNRVRVSFHLGRDDKAAIEQLATERGEPKAENFRPIEPVEVAERQMTGTVPLGEQLRTAWRSSS